MERPGLGAVFEVYHIFRDIYTYEVVKISESTSILSNDTAPTRTVPASELSTARNNAVAAGPGIGDVAENASTELSTVDVTGPRGETGDAGIEPGTWTMSYGDADTEPVEEDVPRTGEADTEPGSGNGAGAG